MTETAQTVKEVSQIVSSGVSEAVRSIMPYLQQAAEQLGTTAAYLWQLQVKQAYVVGAKYVLTDIICFALLYLVYRFCKYMYFTEGDYGRHSYRYQSQDMLGMLGGLVCLSITVPCVITIVGSIGTMLTLLFNPEYWALNQVILLLKGGLQ